MKSQGRSSRRKIRIKFTFLGGFEFKEKEIETEEGKRYSEILEEIGINPETVVIVREKPIPIDEIATEGVVKVLRVISGGAPTKILIVDDDLAMRELLKIILKDFEVYEAGDGREAVELYKRVKPQIVLMDILMPIMNGVDATREILKIDPNAKIIGITAFASHRGEELLKAGAREIIEKPFTRKKIVETIKKYLP